MEIDTKVMGEKLVKLRGSRTRSEVSDALGISKSALAMYEAGERIPRDTVKCRIANYYNVTVAYIFFNMKVHE